MKFTCLLFKISNLADSTQFAHGVTWYCHCSGHEFKEEA